MPSRKTSQKHAAEAQEEVKPPEGRRPWEDRSLSSEERYKSYLEVALKHVRDISEAVKGAGPTSREGEAIRKSLETEHWISELTQLGKETPEQFCARIDVRAVLGNNFLGAAAWKEGFKVDVGAEPPLPATIIKALLEPECPLHPGQLIKDTHLLVLMPKTVDGKPYTALELDRLCAGKTESGDKLIYDGEEWATRWKSMEWASTPQAQSEWVLIPKSDPDPKKLHPNKGDFRYKDIAQQDEVLAGYPEYREAKSVELMTAVLLNDVVRGAPRMLKDNYLRCEEPNASLSRHSPNGAKADGGRVCVGYFYAHGLLVDVVRDGHVIAHFGRALARK